MVRDTKPQLVKLAPPPSELPIYQREDPSAVSFFGRTNYESTLEEKKFIFGIKRKDRVRNVYIIGKSGVGKTKLLELLIRQDVAGGHGLMVIDPYGEIIDATLDFIPKERLGDVVVINPADISAPPAFNALADVPKEFRHQYADHLTEMIARPFGHGWTHHMEYLCRYAILALLDYPKATLGGLLKILTNRTYRTQVTETIEDDLVKSFWNEEFNDWQKKYESEAIIPLVNRLDAFVSNPYLRSISHSEHNFINIPEIVRNGKILFVHLAKNKIGEHNAGMLAALMMAKLHQASLIRERLSERDKKDFYLYVDEFHHAATSAFQYIYTEARKHRITSVVTHQYAAQFSEGMHDALIGNTGTIIAFRVGAVDAKWLQDEFSEIVASKDFMMLRQREFYIKMTIDNDTYDPFSAETLTVLPQSGASMRKDIMRKVVETYTILKSKK